MSLKFYTTLILLLACLGVLMMSCAQVNVTQCHQKQSLSGHYWSPADEHTLPTYEVTSGFKLFTVKTLNYCSTGRMDP